MHIRKVNEGDYIDYAVEGTRIFFGDDELMINAGKYQGDEERTVDIVVTRQGTLAIGAESGYAYAAQIVIPAAEYEETETEDESGETVTQRKTKEIDMDHVTLVLYGI